MIDCVLQQTKILKLFGSCLLFCFFFPSLDSCTKEPLLCCQYLTVLIAAENLNLEEVCYRSQMTAVGCVIDGQFLFAEHLFVLIMLSGVRAACI